MQDFGDEIAASVLGVFDSPTASEATWHGGCLALAELARRGLLLPHRLPEAASIVEQGLVYDVRRGMHRCSLLCLTASALVVFQKFLSMLVSPPPSHSMLATST